MGLEGHVIKYDAIPVDGDKATSYCRVRSVGSVFQSAYLSATMQDVPCAEVFRTTWVDGCERRVTTRVSSSDCYSDVRPNILSP